MIGTEREDVVTFNGMPLRLSFEPSAIREHFADDEDDPTEGMTDDQLARAGSYALCDDSLYAAFHEALVGAVDDVQQEADE